MPYILEHNAKRNKKKSWIDKNNKRTSKKEDAKEYPTKVGAKIAISRFKNKYPEMDIKIVTIGEVDENLQTFDSATATVMIGGVLSDEDKANFEKSSMSKEQAKKVSESKQKDLEELSELANDIDDKRDKVFE